MTKPNVDSTVEVVDQIAGQLRRYADDIERIGKQMRERQDLTLASEVLCEIRNCFHNLRLDLLVSRPLREMERREEHRC